MRDTQPTRRSLLKLAGATLGTGGLTTSVSATESSRPELAEPVTQDPPFVVQTVQFQFVPQVLVVPEGATVTWLGGRIKHTIESAETFQDAMAGNGESNCEYPIDCPGGSGGEFEDCEIPDGTFAYCLPSGVDVAHTFDEPGQYPYFCTPHYQQNMYGMILVV